jgi:tetraacyldisaccharide 4'-kinase
LLDDGFQNPSIAKDLSLLVIDAEYGFGNGKVIPAGPLREPVAGGLCRADAVVLVGDGNPPPEVRARGHRVIRARLEPADAAGFNGTRVVAFAGIGRPAKFFASLRDCGAELLSAHPFPDHHRYAEGELFRLRQEAEAAGARLVTTAKDWARLPPFWRRGIEVLAVEIRWQDAAAVAALLCEVLRPAGKRQAGDGHD